MNDHGFGLQTKIIGEAPLDTGWEDWSLWQGPGQDPSDYMVLSDVDSMRPR